MMDNELAIVEEQKQTKALPQGVRAVGQRQSPHSCRAWSSLFFKSKPRISLNEN
jgi:hypothetical protein